MIFVDKQTKEARLSKCLSCEHFVKETQSCGTLVVGNDVKVGNRTIHLCGCLMRVKTKLKTSACPLNKWSRQVDAATMKELKVIYEKYKKSTSIPTTEAKEVFRLYNKLFGTKKEFTTCTPCVKQMWDDIKQSFE